MENIVKTSVSLNKKEIKKQRAEKRIIKRNILGLPIYCVGEEIFSAVTHGIGTVLSVAALVFLLISCRKDVLTVASAAIFGGTMTLLYLVSTLYHALGVYKAKKVFRILDHCTIFLLIAGTYTPITLLCIRGCEGFTMFCVVWAAAIIGIVLNSVDLKRFAKLSMACYIAMGWIVIAAMERLLMNMNETGVWALFIGGIFYTVGAVVYGIGKRVKYMHSIWHIFVLLGSLSHTVSIYQIVV